MPHRDELEAAHARVDALERELEDARSDAHRSRMRAAELERLARSSEPSRSDRKKDKEKKRKKQKKEREESSSVAAEPRSGWSERRRYQIGVAVLAAVAYGAGAVALFGSSDAETPSAVGFVGPVVGMIVGTVVLGIVFRAPSTFNGAIITLLVSALALGMLFAASSEHFIGEIVPAGAVRTVARVVLTIAGVALSVVISAAWIPGAASSPETGGD